jgi:AbrB family looped-hinge helix DNA binding protein
MAKVTSKLQVTIPKAVADRYGLRPGSQIAFEPAGDAIRVVPEGGGRAVVDAATRLKLFDEATERQRLRGRQRGARAAKSRGWAREDLYRRAVPRRH